MLIKWTKHIRIILVMGLLFLCSKEVAGNETIKLENVKEDFLLFNEHLQYFEDKNRQYSIRNILQMDSLGIFADIPKEVKNFRIENTSSAYWIRFKIQGSSNISKNYILEFIDPHIEEFSIYKIKGDSIQLMGEAGLSNSFSIRSYNHKNFVFSLQSNESAEYIVRLTSYHHNDFYFKIRSFEFFTSWFTQEYYLLGVFYGILFIIFIFAFLLYISSRESFYFFYLTYILSCLLIGWSEDGTGFQYYWPEMPIINTIVNSAAQLLFITTFLLYAESFLQLRKNQPKIYFAILLFYVLYLFTYILDLRYDQKLYVPFYLIFSTILFYGAIRAFKRGVPFSLYFIFAYFFLYLGIILFVVRVSGVIFRVELYDFWFDIFSVYSIYLGIICEILIFTIAMGQRFRFLKREKEIAQERIIAQLRENEVLKNNLNRELELKVKERTAELNEKKEELEHAYEDLKIQHQEIKVLNTSLSMENEHLQVNVKELAKAKVMRQEINFNEFSLIFSDKEPCLKYLSELKYKTSYKCKKCENEKAIDHKESHSKRCSKCGYLESATAYTIFHKVKFPLNKAFYILFLLYSNKNKITTVELSEILELRQSTCWSFVKKIKDRMSELELDRTDVNDENWERIILDNSTPLS